MPGPSILIVGGASLDVLHFGNPRQTVRSAGGAGLYTALAAHRAGARVTMFAPRPDPMPSELAPAADRLNWVGPVVPPDQLPSFEIAHFGDGRAELVSARWGAEALLTVEALPADIVGAKHSEAVFRISGVDAECFAPTRAVAYVGPLADPARMLAFVRHFNSRGLHTAAGTYGRIAYAATEIVRQIATEADIFFCNENEAGALFGGVDTARAEPGKLLFITRGERGTLVFQGEHRTDVSSPFAAELDPTGAGDTFCGTALARLGQGVHPVEAARQACAAAAEMVTAVGPSALLRPPPPPAFPADPRVHVDESQVERVAALIAALPDIAQFSFDGPSFPPAGHPAALDFFFASTLQQFGFWEDDGERYRRPLIATIGGQSLKGSDYLWGVYRRWLDEDPAGLTPSGQARLTREALSARSRSDDGENPMPAFEMHWQQALAYGQDMLALNWTPADILARANAGHRPLQTFLTQLDHVGGYKEDPLRKKSALLAIILQQRPERFLRVEPTEPVPPIIDYHLQRSCLRIGLVEVADPALRQALIDRRLLSPADEWAVRRASHAAIERVQRLSGKPMGAVDWFFFNARRRCPEMTDPNCPRCAVDPVCAHRKELFQPVIRTTDY